MKRILFYGGCHAQVLRDMLARILPVDDFELKLLINFQLIASGQPFPYADLRSYDTVIYSPIENHDSYNTLALREACAAIGCQTICYPWLEWHGYCPGAHKGVFKGRYQWYYPQLQVLAEDFSSFDLFYRHVLENFPDAETIRHVFELSTSKLAEAEIRHEMDVRVTDFIIDQFQSNRLFLISDHPSLKIYETIIAQILVTLKCQPELALGIEEPQGQLRTPIFPQVERELSLNFSDMDWVDQDVLPGMTWDLRTYLRLYFYPGSVILGPLDKARIFSRAARGLQTSTTAASDTRLFARPATPTEGETLVKYELLETLDGPQILPSAIKTFAIKPDEWRSTWIF